MKLSLAAILAIANAAAASASGMPNSNTIELVAADLDQAGTNPAAADPAALFVVDDARAAAAEDASLAPKPSLRATADLPIATDATPSCEGAGDGGCGAGAFCNHPGGYGGACVMCPVEEEHCPDFGEATDACLLACFQGGADGAPASLGVRAGSSLGNCPKGGCCGRNNEYACGCGLWQHPINRNDLDCRQKCGKRADNCGEGRPKYYCPSGGCCGDFNEYACGCGWMQDRVEHCDPQCKEKCTDQFRAAYDTVDPLCDQACWESHQIYRNNCGYCPPKLQ